MVNAIAANDYVLAGKLDERAPTVDDLEDEIIAEDHLWHHRKLDRLKCVIVIGEKVWHVI
jgi:hypothetical protein